MQNINNYIIIIIIVIICYTTHIIQQKERSKNTKRIPSICGGNNHTI